MMKQLIMSETAITLGVNELSIFTQQVNFAQFKNKHARIHCPLPLKFKLKRIRDAKEHYAILYPFEGGLSSRSKM